MQKAQISFDFILAIIMALLLLTTVNVYLKTIQTDVNSINERNQARAILLDAYTSSVAVKAYMHDAANNHLIIDVNFGSKVIKSQSIYPCTITFGQDSISVNLGSATESYTGIDLSGLTFNPSPAVCGEQVRIS